MSTLADLPKIPVDIAEGVTGKVDLKKVETLEKNVLPTVEDMKQERQLVDMLNGIENFPAEQLKHATTNEKVVLPSSEDIKAEKTHQEITHGIESFSPEKLKHAHTEEKICLPTKEDLAREKTSEKVLHFDKNQLKHVEPQVKTNVEVIDN